MRICISRINVFQYVIDKEGIYKDRMGNNANLASFSHLNLFAPYIFPLEISVNSEIVNNILLFFH